MSPEKKKDVYKSLRYWTCSFAVVAGFLMYHSRVPLGPILYAGVLTLAITLFLALRRSSPPIN